MSMAFNDITKENLASFEGVIKQILSRASFLAIDTEFTGLGGQKNGLQASNLDERYVNMCKSVKSHALLSLGITAFEDRSTNDEDDEDDDDDELNEISQKIPEYAVHNFNFTLFCQCEYGVSPNSLEFLLDSGFDFNKQIRHGIPYLPGRDKPHSKHGDHNSIMRSIFSYIVSLNIPIVVHNGFLDLMYLYYSFYEDLPETLGMFIADLSEMFPGGIYDTKHVADIVSEERVTFLAYLFKKYEREQDERHLKIEIQPRLPTPSSKRPREDSSESNSEESTKNSLKEKPYCEQYANHGFCRKRMKCGKSHDLDIILDDHYPKSTKRRKVERNQKNNANDNINKNPLATNHDKVETSSPTVTSINGSINPLEHHMAYFDAYMTGFIFARHLIIHSKGEVLNNHKNKMYMIGRNLPLLVQKSQFSRTSNGHEEKKQKV